jgi:hypothetical protein
VIDWLNGPIVIGPIVRTTDVAAAAAMVSAKLRQIAELGAPREIEVADPANTKPDQETVAIQFMDGKTPVWVAGYPADGMTFGGRLAGAGAAGTKVDLGPGQVGVLERGSGGGSTSVTWFVGTYNWNLVIPPDTLGADEVLRLAVAAATSQSAG